MPDTRLRAWEGGLKGRLVRVARAGGESVAALHDNLVAADRGRDLAFRGQHWLVIKVKVSVGHMRLL